MSPANQEDEFTEAVPVLRSPSLLARFIDLVETSEPVWLLAGGLAIVVAILSVALGVALTTRSESKTLGDVAHHNHQESQREQESVVFEESKTNEGAKRIDVSGNDLLVKLVERVRPAVVRIECDKSLGSGFLVDKGRIVTNYHVIEGSSQARVVFASGKMASALGWIEIDPDSDMAAIRVEQPDDVEPLSVSRRLPKQGERVIAIGTPSGFTGTVTEGIVSAVRAHRDLLSDTRLEFPFREDVTWVQTSASISRGNSGGPLINIEGEVVGINSYSIALGNDLNLAVSCKDVNQFLSRLHDGWRSFADLPSAGPSPAELAKREEIRRREVELALLNQEEQLRQLKADRDRELSEIRRQQQAKELTDRLNAETRRQKELDRIEVALRTLRSEVMQIEAEGTQLTSQRSAIVAQGTSTHVEVQQIASRLTLVAARLQAVNAAIERRRSFVRGSPKLLDGERASYDAVGIALLQAEAISLNQEGPLLQQRLGRLESRYAGLVSQANDLQMQIAYKAKQRELRMADMATAVRKYQEVSKSP